MNTQDTWSLGGREFTSRFILGSGKYSLELIEAAVRDAGAQMITLAVRRANTTEKENILDYIPQGVTLLPNTSGARNAEEAVRIARLARELGCGDFVKIEIMRDTKYLLPDNQETIKATEILAKEGFVVMPYMYPDLNAARDLVNAGAACGHAFGLPHRLQQGAGHPGLSSRFSLMRSTCPSLWTRALAGPPRPARPWRWARRPSWPTPPWPPPGTCPSWPPPSARPSRRAGRPICPASAGCSAAGPPPSDPLTGFLRD